MSNLLDIPWHGSLGCVRVQAANLSDLGLSGSAARIVARHTPVALVLDNFYSALENTSKRTPFPASDLDKAFQSQGCE